MKQVGFKTEEELVRCYSNLIEDAINITDLDIGTQSEVRAPGSITDLVIFNEEGDQLRYVITIEFKLSNWRRALNQAFRNRNFGNEAYVILDRARSKSAINNIDLFKKANVGLITIDAKSRSLTWYSPMPGLPFSKEFSQMVARSLLFPRQPVKKDLTFINSLKGSAALTPIRAILDSQYSGSTRNYQFA